MKNKILVALLCFLSDAAVSLWSYFKMTNYDEYVKAIKQAIDSPDFQLQIYQIFLQTLTLVLIIFLILHLVIYVLFYKEKKLAIKYVRLYSFMAAISAVAMIISLKAYFFFIPGVIYTYSFIEAGKMIPKKIN